MTAANDLSEPTDAALFLRQIPLRRVFHSTTLVVLASVVLHLAVLLLLAHLYFPLLQLGQMVLVATVASEEMTVPEDLSEISLTADTDTESSISPMFAADNHTVTSDMSNSVVAPVPSSVSEMVTTSATEVSVFSNSALQRTGETSVQNTVILTGSLDGRSQRIGLSRGGSAASEKAVEEALRWLAAHQLPDGSWSYDLIRNPNCRGECRNTGLIPSSIREKNAPLPSRNSATALAILPFLAAGITPKDTNKEHSATVKSGLLFLVRNMIPTPYGGSFMDDRQYGMYHHGICAMALCEAAAMTKDRELLAAAQKSVDFILYAQDPVTGGWRYEPRQAGDTSVLGWQWMALKSGEMGMLRIPPESKRRATFFLDSVVGYDGGAGYGYTNSSRKGEESKATTAIGLLCRMYSGWTPEHPAMQRGVTTLSQYGPDLANMYYSYYATQVMCHYGGPPWEKWNRSMREDLIRLQETQGHEKGSWFVAGERPHQYNEYGGRLGYTALAALTLEVYYRYLPLFQKSATATVPLD